MRNVWKGLVVGGFTGVVAGVALDSIARASERAAQLGEHVRDRAPEAGRWVQSLSDKAGDWVRDSDIPDHLRDAGQRVKESGAVHRATEVGHDVASAIKETASSSGG